MITIDAKIFGRKTPVYTQQLDTLSANTLREMITAVVIGEVEQYNARQVERQFFRLMTAKQITDAAEQGRIDPAAKESPPQLADANDAVDAAITAFKDGLFFVFVDGEQQEGLDDVVAYDNSAATIQFMRLTPLIGG